MFNYLLHNTIVIFINFNLVNYLIFFIIGNLAAGSLDVTYCNLLLESLPVKFRGIAIIFTFCGYGSIDSLHLFVINYFTSNDEVNMRAILLIIGIILKQSYL